VDKNFRPKNIHMQLSKSKFYGTSIKPELAAEQIEITTDPSFSLEELEERILVVLRETLKIADEADAQLLPLALFQEEFTIFPEPRYEFILDFLGLSGRENAPIVASDQINIAATNEHEAIETYNRFRNLLPLLTGFAVSSPLRDGKFSRVQSERLRSYNMTLAAHPELTGFPEKFDTLEEYVEVIRTLPIFQHPNMYYKYIRPMFHRGVAAEIRSLDKQPSVKEYMGLVALTKGLVSLEVEENPLVVRDFYKAVANGIYDKRLFKDLLVCAECNLSKDEKHFLQPLFERLKEGTVADKMKKKIERGTSMREIYEQLVFSLRENRSFR